MSTPHPVAVTFDDFQVLLAQNKILISFQEGHRKWLYKDTDTGLIHDVIILNPSGTTRVPVATKRLQCKETIDSSKSSEDETSPNKFIWKIGNSFRCAT